jgi:response regulator RpfG family c-di-GMP phosphodiesterase
MDKQKISILYLDDEEQNLFSFKAAFRRFYNIHTAPNAEQAIKILHREKIHILLLDHRMPDISGVKFLELIEEEFPEIIKIMVTGYVELDKELNNMVENGYIYRFIMKPWSENEMRIALEDGFKAYSFLFNKKQEMEYFKSIVSDQVRAPIANLEGLLALARFEIKDQYALQDYFEYMNQSIETLKYRIRSAVQSNNISSHSS